MERPTCKTCPYWEKSEEDEEQRLGLCHRHAPQTIGYPQEISWKSWPFANWIQVDKNDWCGEHPDFPAYIASLKPSSVPKSNLPLHDKIAITLKQLEPKRIEEIISILRTKREREIAKLSLGLTPDGIAYSLDELRRMYKVSLERMRQMQDNILNQLASVRDLQD